MKKNILIVLYNINKAQEHEWFVKYMNPGLFNIEFALINGKDGFMHQFLLKEKIPVHLFEYSGKRNLPGLILKLFLLMKKKQYHIVHAHLFEGTLAGMIAAFMAGIKRRIVTRHYSDFHHVYNPAAVKYDKLINFLATDIVAICMNVENLLVTMENVPPGKIHLIHHGVDFSDYQPGAVSRERIENVKIKYSLNSPDPVIGVISKFVEWKGVQYIIPAFKQILKVHPDAVMILANAHGPYHSEVMSLLSSLPESSYRLIKFENDIVALYKTFTCFVHVPISATAEAFGQVYIEAVASQVPSVVTLSGIAPEFLKDRVNCFVVPYKNSEAIVDGINYILANRENVELILKTGYDDVLNMFNVKRKFEKLEKLYCS